MEHKHLRRLERIWSRDPIFFITVCTQDRREFCHRAEVASILKEELQKAEKLHGWYIGAYVFMPDHIHFLCRSSIEAKSLSDFMKYWKQWTSKRILRETKVDSPVWQAEFFDRVLRSDESYSQKREYIWNNPVRAGLVTEYSDWPWVGELNELS